MKLDKTIVKKNPDRKKINASSFYDSALKSSAHETKKIVEKELYEKQYFIQRIVDAIPYILYIYDLEDSKYVYSNRELTELLGYSRQEIKEMDGFSLKKVTSAKEYKKIESHYRKLTEAKDGEIIEIEYKLRDANKNLRWIRSRDTVFMRSVEGKVKQIIGTLQDVTEYKRAGEALRESEERYSLALKSANVGSWDWDIKSGAVKWSEKLEPIFGFKKGQFPGTYEAFIASIYPEDRQKVINAVNACLKKGKEYDIEHRLIWPDRTIRWVSESGNVIEDKKGNPVRMIGIVSDITGRKKIEEKLVDSELRFRSVTQSAKDAIISADENGKIVSWNKGAEQIFEYTEKEMLNKSVSLIMPAMYRQAHTVGIRRVSAGGAPHLIGKTVELTGLKKNGKEFPAELSMSSWNIAGKIFFTGIIRDITERKELERRKNEFISIASHELKTPITTIKAYAQILEKRLVQCKDKRNSYFSSKIVSQVDKITALINDLLDAGKIEAGRLSFTRKDFDLNALIKRIIVDFQYSTEAHEIVKRGQIGTRVFGNPDRIGQVFVNLLTNAIKYSPGKNKIIVGLKSHKNHAVVSVKDFGKGIPKDKQKKIFERFFRIDETEEQTTSNSGLGLYISSEIIKRHNGKIWVESTVGKGSTFYFTVPLAGKHPVSI